MRSGQCGIPVTVLPKREPLHPEFATDCTLERRPAPLQLLHPANTLSVQPRPLLKTECTNGTIFPLYSNSAPYPPPLLIRHTYNQSVPQPPPRPIKRIKRRATRDCGRQEVTVALRPRPILCERCKGGVGGEGSNESSCGDGPAESWGSSSCLESLRKRRQDEMEIHTNKDPKRGDDTEVRASCADGGRRPAAPHRQKAVPLRSKGLVVVNHSRAHTRASAASRSLRTGKKVRNVHRVNTSCDSNTSGTSDGEESSAVSASRRTVTTKHCWSRKSARLEQQESEEACLPSAAEDESEQHESEEARLPSAAEDESEQHGSEEARLPSAAEDASEEDGISSSRSACGSNSTVGSRLKAVLPEPEHVHVKKVTRCVTSAGQLACVGDVVWAKIYGCPWWPARIECITVSVQEHSGLVLKQEAGITWFGSTTVSCLPLVELVPFMENFEARFSRRKKGHGYRRAVSEAAEAARQLTPEVRKLLTQFET
uniref:PWWP domain-containing protein 2A-like isoform X2 n=1 Tax=Myxine glutinosa TaxID=7769 RepID=UPI00359027EF